jgi:hypothetical protein
MGSGSHPVRGLRHSTNHSSVHAERILLPGLPSSVQSWMPESLPSLFRSPAMNDGGGADRCGCASGFPVALAAHRPPGFLERFARWAAGKPHCSKEWFKGMVQRNGSKEIVQWNLFKGNCSIENRSPGVSARQVQAGDWSGAPANRGAGVIGPLRTTPPPSDAGHGRPSPKSSQCPRSGWNR